MASLFSQPRRAQKPFTLEELVYFIENSSLCGLSGSLHLGYNEYNLECMDSRNELRDLHQSVPTFIRIYTIILIAYLTIGLLD